MAPPKAMHNARPWRAIGPTRTPTLTIRPKSFRHYTKACQPPSIYDSKSCTLGGYPSYVIKAKTVSDIQSGVNFARNDFLRLVVKNTGHDFAGKSTGYGAFSIWTHNLKDIQYFDNYVDDSGYKGPAIKAGAGVQAFELYKFANEKKVVAVAGEGQVRKAGIRLIQSC
jgi:hypothetical protein